MNGQHGYAVFLFPQALEALGDAVAPFLQDGPAGPHIGCHAVDTAGAFVELTLEGRAPDGREVTLELMIPVQMVRMIVSTHSDGMFGFGPHAYPAAPTALPVLGPTAEPADAPSEALPGHGGTDGGTTTGGTGA